MLPSLTIVSVLPTIVAIDVSPEVYKNAPSEVDAGSIMVYVPPLVKTNVSTLKEVMTGVPGVTVNVTEAVPTV